MRYVEAKRDSDIKLTGIQAEIEWKGATQKELVLRDAAGNVLKVTGMYGIEVLVPAPPVFVTRYRVAGSVPGVVEAVLEYHDSKSDADARVRAIDSAIPVEHSVKVEQVEIEEDEADKHPPAMDTATISRFDPDQVPF